jgi:hypothetical protein
VIVCLSVIVSHKKEPPEKCHDFRQIMVNLRGAPALVKLTRRALPEFTMLDNPTDDFFLPPLPHKPQPTRLQNTPGISGS